MGENTNRRLAARSDSGTMVAAQHRHFAAEGAASAGTPLSLVLRREGALQITMAARVVQALLQRLLEARAAHGHRGSLSTASVFLHDRADGTQDVSIARTATQMLATPAATNDVETVGHILIECLLGASAGEELAERTLQLAPARAATLLAIALEAARGRIDLDELAARLDVWAA